MNKFTSFLKLQIQSFIFYQIASNHWNVSSYEPNLLLFDRYCQREYPDATILSQEMVDSWCNKRKTESNNSCRARISVVISFIHYLQKRGLTDVIDPIIPKKERKTYIPHAFTHAELNNFFIACDTLPSAPRTSEILSRKITVPVFFRLLYSSGMRTNETRMFRVKDVDLENGIINIHYSKGNAQHYVVLHNSMLKLLQRYNQAIDKQCPDRTYFFPGKGDSYHNREWVSKNFRNLWDKYNDSYATAYELRHHYAIENINSWTDDGFSFHQKLLYLSKSMGHCNVESTKYYYSLVPRLSQILNEKTGQTFESIVPEVSYEES